MLCDWREFSCWKLRGVCGVLAGRVTQGQVQLAVRPADLLHVGEQRGLGRGRSRFTWIRALTWLLENARVPQKLFSVRNWKDPPQKKAVDLMYLTTDQIC